MPPNYERKIAILEEKLAALFETVQDNQSMIRKNSDTLVDLRMRIAHGERFDKHLGWALGVIYVAVTTVIVKVLLTKLGG